MPFLSTIVPLPLQRYTAIAKIRIAQQACALASLCIHCGVQSSAVSIVFPCTVHAARALRGHELHLHISCTTAVACFVVYSTPKP